MGDEQRSYYAIIPANVRYDNDLPPNAKLLYGEITALCNDKGYCWASNDYFSKLYNVSNRSIQDWLNKLELKMYISRKLIYKKGSKEVEERRIYIGEENFMTSGKNIHGGSEENFTGGSEENFADNNTSFNNTFNNKKERKKKKTSYDEVINSKVENAEIKDLLYEFIKMRALKKKPLTDRALSIQINKLFKISSDLETQKQIIENSIVKCWDEFYELKGENTNVINKGSNEQDLSKYDR